MTAATPAPSARKGRQAALWAAKILVSTALLYILLARVDTSRLWALARNASPVWLAFALLLYLGMVVISAWRWNLPGGCRSLRTTGSRRSILVLARPG